MMVYSKLLCEYTIVTDSNDKFKVTQEAGAVSHTITLTAGRYRDHVALAVEIATQLNDAFGTWTAVVSNTTGLLALDCDEAYAMNWNTATYGTTLRDDLGFTGSETGGGGSPYTTTATNIHLGGLYPSEPIEQDDRPLSTGSDRWRSDSFQQEGRTGLLSTKGGANRPATRSITILLAQDDLENFSTWLQRAATGVSFAFYHDRTEAWDGPDDEYKEYKLLMDGEEGTAYDPESLDGINTIWHRQSLMMQARVAPAT
jgi:hypothetical protein